MVKVQKIELQVKDCYVPAYDGTLAIDGNLLIQLQQDVIIHSIKVTLTGQSHCKWSVGGGDQRHRSNASSLNKFLKNKQHLLKPELEGDSKVLLTAGNHVLPFAFRFPNATLFPSTYTTCAMGQITYKLKAKVAKYGSMFDKTTETPIEVCSPTMENMTILLEPVHFEKEHFTGLCCFESQPLIITGCIDKSIIKMKSADRITITLLIDNLTDRVIVPQAFIYEKILFKVTNSDRHKKNLVLHTVAPPVAPNTRKNQVRLYLGPINGNLSGTVLSITNIFIRYQLVVSFQGSGGLEIVFPLVVGI